MMRKPELHKKVINLRNHGLSYKEIFSKVKIGYGTIARWCKEVELSEQQKERLIEKNKNTLMLTGVLLYWAEGTKLNEKEYRQEVTFTNTDEKMIEIMMKFFREVLKIPEEKIRVRVRIGKSGNIQKAQEFWSSVTKIPLEKLKKPELIQLTGKSKSLLKYLNGICRVSVFDVLIARKIDFLIQWFKNFMLP